MRFTARLRITQAAFGAVLFVCAVPASAQSDIVFTPGTGSGEPVKAQPLQVLYAPLSCIDFVSARERLNTSYSPASTTSANLLDKTLLDTALDSYGRNICQESSNSGFGPSQIVIVDFAKPSSQPRLYVVDLVTGQGLGTPVVVAHGVGSDRDDDGIAERFSNVYNSFASSLGAARGGELYTGINGLSLRLDGLDQSNSQMRVRDIVAHSYAPERRRYFNASVMSVRGGKPGMSEGCFVVAPHVRDLLFGVLRDGGFLFAGLGGHRAKEMPSPVVRTEAVVGEVVFVRGTGG